MKIRHVRVGRFEYSSIYYDHLIEGQTPEGRLPRDVEAHALWHYFCVASSAHQKAKENLVAEDEASIVFNAPAVYLGIATQYAVNPEKMGQYWPLMVRQRIALGLSGDDDLPNSWKFSGRSN